jgi:hypothetical protein
MENSLPFALPDIGDEEIAEVLDSLLPDRRRVLHTEAYKYLYNVLIMISYT